MPADTSSSVVIDVTDFVKAWYADESSNFGIIMYTDSSANRFDYNGSNLGYGAGGLPNYLAPMLTINYAAAIPEPAAYVLLGVGVLLLTGLRYWHKLA